MAISTRIKAGMFTLGFLAPILVFSFAQAVAAAQVVAPVPAVPALTDWTGMATFLTALGVFITTVWTAIRTGKNTTTLAHADLVQDEIHKAVNSNMAAAVAEIKDGKETIARMTEKAQQVFDVQMNALRTQVADQERARAALETATQAAKALQERYEQERVLPPRRR